MKLLDLINKSIQIFKKEPDPSKFKNVLVVSNTGFGDTLLSTPAIITLRSNFQDLNITFLINKKIYPLFEDFEYVDDFILYTTGFLTQLKIIRKIRSKYIDTIFLFHSNGPEDIFFSILGGAHNILKSTNNQSHPYKDIFLNSLKQPDKHIIEQRIDLINVFNQKEIYTKMKISPKFHNEKFFKNRTNEILIALQIGAQDIYKIWRIENFIRLANRILSYKPNIDIVVIGSTNLEIALSKKFMKEISQPERVVNLCGTTKLEELPLVLNSINMIVTNDTGIMHLAIALQTPTLSLFSPTKAWQYGPYQDLNIHRVIQKDGDFVNNKPKKARSQKAMDLISVDEVYENTIAMIDGKSNKIEGRGFR